jgi:hypothetical protein
MSSGNPTPDVPSAEDPALKGVVAVPLGFPPAASMVFFDGFMG